MGMNMKTRMSLQAGGYTLIEVLLGMLIFALGMMALAHLQGNLSKASSESNARTVAINIAEETVESLRSFRQVTASETVAAFNNIVTGTDTVQRGNIDYLVTSTVTNYYYNPDAGAFQTTKPDSEIVNADLKRLELTVSWGVGDAAQSFQIDQSTSASGMGTGSVTVVDLISSFTTATGAKVVLNSVGDSLYSPPVNYNPGANPDIISIQLGDNKFKESTTPLPDVIRTDELVETTFDVVTYSQSDSGATFLRREEFRAVSCDCTLRLPDSSDEGGLRPTVWDGYEYTEGEFVSKPYGESSNNQQSIYCDLCCGSHPDGGSGSEDDANDPGRSLYNPFRLSTGYYDSDYGSLEGDHKHYSRNRVGDLVLADSDGDAYVEACRMIRKDGFWRIAQDLRLEGLNAFPADYLDDTSEVGVYSGYVTSAVNIYEFETDPSNGSNPTNPYETAPPALTRPENMSPSLVFPASTDENPTSLPTASGANEQQLRSRGIYVDYMSDVLRARINCLDLGGTGVDCEVPDVNSALEIIPFYDVQLTWLTRWTESPTNNPIDVTNEAIADNNTHDRGIASLNGFGVSIINSAAHGGNLGLTGTDPIDNWYAAELEDYDLYALAASPGSPPVLSGTVTGEILSAVNGAKAADVEIEATGAYCDRTNTGFECGVISGASNPRLTVSNYYKANTVLVACSDVLTIHGQEHVAENGIGNWTRFNLPAGTVENANIVIKEGSCN
jgi:Tfp pilus assembly protein PilV